MRAIIISKYLFCKDSPRSLTDEEIEFFSEEGHVKEYSRGYLDGLEDVPEGERFSSPFYVRGYIEGGGEFRKISKKISSDTDYTGAILQSGSREALEFLSRRGYIRPLERYMGSIMKISPEIFFSQVDSVDGGIKNWAQIHAEGSKHSLDVVRDIELYGVNGYEFSLYTDLPEVRERNEILGVVDILKFTPKEKNKYSLIEAYKMTEKAFERCIGSELGVVTYLKNAFYELDYTEVSSAKDEVIEYLMKNPPYIVSEEDVIAEDEDEPLFDEYVQTNPFDMDYGDNYSDEVDQFDDPFHFKDTFISVIRGV